jgi:glucose uptake protein GlcU
MKTSTVLYLISLVITSIMVLLFFEDPTSSRNVIFLSSFALLMIVIGYLVEIEEDKTIEKIATVFDEEPLLTEVQKDKFNSIKVGKDIF